MDDSAAASSHKDSINDASLKLPALGASSSSPSGPGPVITSQKTPTTTMISSKGLAGDTGNEASVSSTKQQQLLEEGIKRFYMIEGWSEDPYSLKCFVLDKENGEATTWTISPASERNPLAIHRNYSVVALGSIIYMIGGLCRYGFCPDNIIDVCHPHAEVRYFDTLHPKEGWKEAAPMHVARMNPAAAVVDGMIYVFGGFKLGEDPGFGECFDPNTNQWHLFPAPGYNPVFICTQVPYVARDGRKSILIHTEQDRETLYSFLLKERKWKIVSNDFDDRLKPAAILDHILYTVVDDEKQPLEGYDLLTNEWFTVKMPQLDAGIEIVLRSVSVFASGSDKLCLVWYYFDSSVRGKGYKIECLELKLNKSYHGSGRMLNLTASKEFYAYFYVKSGSCHKFLLAL